MTRGKNARSSRPSKSTSFSKKGFSSRGGSKTHDGRGGSDVRSSGSTHRKAGISERLTWAKAAPELPEGIESELWSYLEKHRGKPVGLPDIVSELKLNLPTARKVRRYLKVQEKAGWIEIFRGMRVMLRKDAKQDARRKGQIHGEIRILPDGGALVIDAKEQAIFVPEQALRGALHGDRVLVEIEQDGWGQKKGRITGVEEPFSSRLLGRIKSIAGQPHVSPEDSRYPLLKLEGADDLPSGSMVAFSIERSPDDPALAWAVLQARLQMTDGPRFDIERHAALLDLLAFPPEVEEEALSVAHPPTPEEMEGRLDLREEILFTIDGEDARDFDDAVGLSRLSETKYRLIVAIADVSHYVREGSALDQEASRRATSVYFPATCLPMLPEALSNGICSLRPHEDRLAMAVLLDYVLDAEGKAIRLVKAEIHDAIIQSKARLTYRQVAEVLDGKPDLQGSPAEPFRDSLLEMAEVARLLRRQRMQRGALDLDIPEPKVLFDEKGEVADVIRAERHFSHKVIEEFMLQANEVVARYTEDHHIPSVYRVHGEPNPDKIEAFLQTLETLGVKLPGLLVKQVQKALAAAKGEGEDDSKGKPTHAAADRFWDIEPKMVAQLIKLTVGHPSERLLHSMLLRSLMQATYSIDPSGHFGLALAHYLHFTSPIRRYPDLCVHRLLRRAKEKRIPTEEGSLDRFLEELEESAFHSSDRERLAMQAERDVLSRYRVRLMQKHLGEILHGTVSLILPHGLLVEVDPFFVEGLIHIRSLPSSYVYDRERMSLIEETTGETFQLGDRVEIQVAAASLERLEIDFLYLRRLPFSPTEV